MGVLSLMMGSMLDQSYTPPDTQKQNKVKPRKSKGSFCLPVKSLVVIKVVIIRAVKENS